MASLRFKKDGTPFVDFRYQKDRYRPEFESVREAQKFESLANANVTEAYLLWQQSVAAQPTLTGAREAISLKGKVESFKENYCSQKSRPNEMKSHIDRLFCFITERRSADDVAVSSDLLDDVEAFQTSLINDCLANSSINRYFATIKTFFSRLYRAQQIEINISDLIQALPVTAKKRDLWENDSTSRLVSELISRGSDQVLVDIAESMELTPFGPIDFARLKWSMIDFDLGEIRTIRCKGKGLRDWVVPMPLSYQALLLKIKKRHEAVGFGKPADHVYLTSAFLPVLPGRVSKSLERARKAAGIGQVPYSSRHRMITNVAEKAGRDVASKFAGHASVKTTEKHYLGEDLEKFREKMKEAFV
jgi:integrase